MNGFVLDTNVISEVRRAETDPAVAHWFEDHDPLSLFLTATVVGELAAGIAVLEAGRQRLALDRWLDELIGVRFAGRVLPYDADSGLVYGGILAAAQASGRRWAVPDLQIAAVTRRAGMVLVTRNIRHFQDLGVTLIDPWQPIPRASGR